MSLKEGSCNISDAKITIIFPKISANRIFKNKIFIVINFEVKRQSPYYMLIHFKEIHLKPIVGDAQKEEKCKLGNQ